MLFVRDGELYFQDGNDLPIRLTYVGGKGYEPILSDDNRKLVFLAVMAMSMRSIRMELKNKQ